MSIKRRVKQGMYAGGLFLFVGIGMLSILAGWLQPSGEDLPRPTPVVEFADIEVEETTVIPHADNVDIVARLRNPNVLAGTEEYPLTFILYAADNTEITRHTATSYLLPGGVQHLLALHVPVKRPVARVTVEKPPTPALVRVDPDLAQTSFGTFLRSRAIDVQAGQAREQQKGVVTNSGTLPFRRVQVIALAFDDAGMLQGVGVTFVGDLIPGEQREFTVAWPIPARATARVVTVASTNIFDDENLLRAIGDPRTLR